MTDRPTSENPPSTFGDPPAPVAAPPHPSAASQTLAPTAALISSDAAPGLPDLSVGPGTSFGASHAAPEPPKLDGYQVIDAIGQGGMGTVWRGIQLSTRRNVALKLISAAGFASDRARQRFDREVEITARLEHPNIARVYDSGINHGVYFYAMELIDGKPLDEYVVARKLNRREILELFAIVCRGVDHAHERGVIHRDLKPGNILVSPDGQPHVLDFGLAKALMQAGKEAGISIDGDVAGTPGFMSPEQAAGKLDIDARCDVYSLGVILYRLLTGGTPHELSGTYLDILRRVSEEEPKRPRQADKTIDRDLEALMLHAIERSASQRYKTAGDLARDIENYLAGDPVSAKPATKIYFLQKRIRKHRVKITTAAIVAVLVGLAALLAIRLIGSHRRGIESANNAFKAAADKEISDRKTALANGNKAVGDGDSAMSKGNWNDAETAYRAAINDYDRAHASPIRARLGLWDLSRTAPPPVAFMAASAKSEMTAGPMLLRDGHRVLAGYADGSVAVLDVVAGKIMTTLSVGKSPVRSIAASANGPRVIVGGDAGALALWNLSTGTIEREFKNPAAPLQNRVTHVALSADGRYLLSVSGMTPELLSSPTYNDTLTVWDVASGRVLLATDRAAGVLAVAKTVTHAAFSPDGSRIVTSSAAVDVWNVSDGKRAAGMANSATAVAFSDDGHSVAAGSFDGAIRLLNVSDGNVPELQDHGAAIRAIGFNATGSEIIAAMEDGSFRALALDGKALWSQPSRGDIDSVSLSANADLAITANDAGLSLWRMSPPKSARLLAVDGPYPNVSLSGDGGRALVRSARRGASVGRGAGVSLFDTASAKPIQLDAAISEPADAVVLSRDGRKIAVLSGQTLLVAPVGSPGTPRRYHVDRRADWMEPCIAISSTGDRVTFCSGNVIAIYHSSNAPPLLIFTANKARITSASMSIDGKTVLIGDEAQTAAAFDAETGSAIATFRGHAASVNAVAISADGTIAVTGAGAAKFAAGNDNSVRTWNLRTGQQLTNLDAHAARVRAVAISGDGRLVVSGGDDSVVIISDLSTGEMLRPIRTNHGPILSLSFDQSGKQLLVGSDTVSLWNFEKGIEPSASK